MHKLNLFPRGCFVRLLEEALEKCYFGVSVMLQAYICLLGAYVSGAVCIRLLQEALETCYCWGYCGAAGLYLIRVPGA